MPSMRLVNLMPRGLLLAIIVGIGSTSALAQDVDRLKATKTFRCSFIVSSSVNMDGDVPKASVTADSLDVVFDQVDTKAGTGRVIGNVGGEDITVISGRESLTMIEGTGAGAAQVTVLYMAQNSDGRFKAVHSRHTAIPGGVPIASQFSGSCRAML